MDYLHNNKIDLQKILSFAGALVVACALFVFYGTQNTLAAISTTLDLGSQGAEVTELQTYLAKNANFYPSGLITGYYGQLTKAAVERFQTAHGIISQGTPATTGYGRVGPLTMARINELMGNGGQMVSWDTVPVLSKTGLSTTDTSATLTWTTNEAAVGKVYYNDTPLVLNEVSAPRQLPYISGTAVTSNNGVMSTNHAVTIRDLDPDTRYYFLTEAVDSGGNVSIVWPETFRTDKN